MTRPSSSRHRRSNDPFQHAVPGHGAGIRSRVRAGGGAPDGVGVERGRRPGVLALAYLEPLLRQGLRMGRQIVDHSVDRSLCAITLLKKTTAAGIATTPARTALATERSAAYVNRPTTAA